MPKRKRITFKRAYAADILEGRKESTVRLNTNLKKGDIVDIISGIIKIGTAKVELIEEKTVSQLTDEDAKKDGFRTREELVKALRKIYGNKIDDSTRVKVIHFKLLGRGQDHSSSNSASTT
jgi:hypothetical protein